jgi:hypothetical protein
MLQPQRKQHFLDLAAQRARVGQEKCLGDLLGDRRTTLHDMSRRQIDPGSPRQTDWVDPRMMPEAPILHRDGRLGQVWRQIGQEQLVADDVTEIGESLPVSI